MLGKAPCLEGKHLCPSSGVQKPTGGTHRCLKLPEYHYQQAQNSLNCRFLFFS